MDSTQNPAHSVFGDLQVDQLSASYLGETARWGKFLAIMGFIGCGFLLLASLTPTAIMTASARMGSMRSMPAGMGSGRTVLTIVYLALAVAYFFPCLYLLRFSGRMQAALSESRQEMLIESFRNLKSCFKFMGILTIGLIALYLLIVVSVVVSASMDALPR